MNDATHDGSDSFTNVAGNDGNTGNSPDQPKLTVAAGLALCGAGDTLYIDAGTFAQGAALTIPASSVWMIGVDSSLTIIDFVTKGVGREISASGRDSITIRNLRVTRGEFGIHFSNCDNGLIERVRTDDLAQEGISLENNSDTNVVRDNYVLNAGDNGIDVRTSEQWNVVRGNRVEGSVDDGIQVIGDLNTIESNVVLSSTVDGIHLEPGADENFFIGNDVTTSGNDGIGFSGGGIAGGVVVRNRIYGNGNAAGDYGISLADAVNVLVAQNTFDSNIDWQVRISGASSACTITKNAIRTSPYAPDKGLSNTSGNPCSAVRNWWYSIDSTAIGADVTDAAGLTRYIPYRLGIVDTGLAADSVAPRAPDTVAAATVDTWTIRVSWAPVTLDEEADDFAVNLTGYRIYRSAVPNTSSWALHATAGANTTSISDSGLDAGQAWYYRVTSRDDWATENQSFYSDSIAAGATLSDTLGPNYWYVNDGTLNGDDVYTTAVGNDGNAGTSPDKPKLTIAAVLAVATAGDTLFIDAGTFTPGAALSIDTSSFWMIGVDSVLTVIDFNDSNTANNKWIGATGRQRLTLRNFKVKNAEFGVYFNNTDTSSIENITAEWCRATDDAGIYLTNSSDSNTITGNHVYACYDGIILAGGSDTCYLYNNTVDSAPFGLDFWDPSCQNVVVGCTITRSLVRFLGADNIVFRGNFIYDCDNGINVYDGSDRNQIYNNLIDTCSGNGITMNYGGAASAVTGNTVAYNTIRNVAGYGLLLDQDADLTRFTGNLVQSSGRPWQANDGGGGAGPDPGNGGANVIEFNNFVECVNSGIDQSSGGSQTRTQNLEDSGLSGNPGLGAGFRSTSNETAPCPPGLDVDLDGTDDKGDTVYWIGAFGGANPTVARTNNAPTATSIKVDGAAPIGQTIYNYRPTVTWTFTDGDAADTQTDFWIQVSTSSAFAQVYKYDSTQIHDTRASWTPASSLAGGTYWIRIAVNDGVGDSRLVYWSGANSGWSSGVDSFVLIDTTGPNKWYVNDADPARTGDSFTTRAGDTSYNGLSPDSPMIRIDSALSRASYGDTIYVDAGSFQEYAALSVSKSVLSIVGAGRNLTVVGRPVAAATQVLQIGSCTNALVRDLCVRGGTSDGILLNGALYAEVRGCSIAQNSRDGIAWNSGLKNRIYDNHIHSNGRDGMQLNDVGNVVDSNTIWSNTAASGIYCWNTGDSNQISGNVIGPGNLDGIYLEGPDSDLIIGNVILSNSNVGLSLDAANKHRVVGNVFRGNASRGIEIFNGANLNVIQQNTFDSNSSWQISLTGATNVCTVTKNVFSPSPYRPDSGVSNATGNVLDFRRNWWGTTDSAAVKNKFSVGGVANCRYTPWRLGIVDTALNADTVAPRAPDTVGVTALAETRARVTWAPVTLDEEVDDLATSVAGYRIYRSQNANTSLWVQCATAGAAAIEVEDSGLSGYETYYWRVTALDNWTPYENEAFYSDSIAGARTLDSTTPAAFRLRAPPQNCETTAVSVRFEWDTSVDTMTGLASYRLLVSTLSSFAYSKVDTTTTPPDTAEVISTLSGTDTWYWRVIATDTAGNARACLADSAILVDTSVDTVSLATPADGSETSDTKPGFTWAALADSCGVDSYVIQISTDAAFAFVTVTDTVEGTATAYESPTLVGVETYAWRVRAIDELGNVGAWSDSRLFVVETGTPSAFSLDTPIGGIETATIFVRLVWTASSDAQSGLAGYRVQVSTSSAFSFIVRDGVQGPTTETSFILSTDTFYWRIFAIDEAGNSIVSTPTFESFHMTALDTVSPKTFPLVAPALGAETSTDTITFRWQDALDSSPPVTYILRFSSVASFASYVDSAVGADTSCTRVLYGTETWYWRVVASDANGNTRAVGDSWFLLDTTPPAAFLHVSPADTFETKATSVVLSWAASGDVQSGLASYRIQVSTAATFDSSFRVDGVQAAASTETTVSLFGTETWWWRVTAIDEAGNTRAATADSHLLVDTTPPDSFGLVAPPDSYTTSVSTLLFEWDTSTDSHSGLARYRVQISDTITFVSIVVETTTLPGDTAEVITLTGGETYWWRVVAEDDAGNTQVTAESSTIVFDTTTPTPFALDRPPDGVETSATTVLFSWQASSDTGSGVARYRLVLATTATFDSLLVDTTLAAADTAEIVPTLFGTDTWWWCVVAEDWAGNKCTSTPVSRLLLVDTAPPAAFLLDTPLEGTETTASTIDFGWGASSDTQSGFQRYQFRVSTIASFAYCLVDSSTGTTPGTTVALPANDTYFWRVLAYDDAGNTRAPADSSFLIDTAPPPAFSLSDPANLTETRATSVRFVWGAAADTGSGLRWYRFQVSTLPGFDYFVVNETTGATAETTSALPANDTYWWRVIAYDDLGNARASSDTRQLLVDTAPPVAFTLLDPPAGHETRAATIAFSWAAAADTQSGLNRYQFQVSTLPGFEYPVLDTTTGTTPNTTVALPANDTYFWRAVAFDDAGNTTSSNTRALLVDTTPPETFALTSPAAGHETLATTIAFSWGASSDTQSGLNRYQFQVSTLPGFSYLVFDSTTATSTNTTVALPANEAYWWRAVAYDDVGNSTAAGSRLLIVDTTPPAAFDLTAPTAGHETTATRIHLRWQASSDALSGLGTYYLWVATSPAFDSSFAVSEGVDPLVTEKYADLAGSETWWWRVVAYDEAGNSTACRADTSFVIDTTTPQIFGLLSPADAAETRADTIAFVWAASDDTHAGLARYRLQVSSTPDFTVLVADSDHRGSADTILRLAPNDTYWWRVVAYDDVGNSTPSSETRQVLLDSTTPQAFGLLSPADAAETRADTIAFVWTASDDTHAGFARYRLQVSSTPGFSVLIADSDHRGSADTLLRLAPNDTYWWRVVAYDDAGNSTPSSETRQVLLDTTTPQAFLRVFPPPAFETSATSVRFDWTASDDTHSGLDTYHLQATRDPSFASIDRETWLAPGDLAEVVSVFGSDTWYWRIFAADDVGNSTLAGPDDSGPFVMDTTTPALFALLAPLDGVETSLPSVTLDWTASDDTHSGLNRYRLFAATAASFAAPYIDSSNGLSTDTTLYLPPNDTWWWRVWAVDDVGNTTASGDSRVLVDTAPPPAFDLDTPADGFETMSTTVAFSWQASADTVSGTNRYQFHVSTLASFAYHVYDSSTGLTPNTTVSLPANDTYWWRVVAWDDVGNTRSSTSTRFLVLDTSTPSAFALDTPADGLETQSRTVVFDWSPSDDTGAGLMHYVLEVSTGPAFDSYVVYDTVGLATAETITLPPNDTYFWRVVAYDSAWNAETSAARWIVVDTSTPQAFTLDTPAQNFETMSQTVRFSWNTSDDTGSGLMHYRFHLSADSTFASYLYAETVGYLTNTTVYLPANDTYFWRVVAYDSAWNAETTNIRHVVVDTSTPQAFALDTPADGLETQSRTVVFDWSPSDDTGAGLMHYVLEVSTGPTFDSYVVYDTVGLATTETITLPPNDTFWWRVVAYDSAWNAETSAARWIVVDTSTPQAFALDTPADGLETQSRTVVFDWSPSDDTGAGLMHYVLEVSTGPTFDSYVVYDTVGLATAETITLPPNDTFWWRVVTYDSAWNAETSAARWIVVDTSTPQAFLLDTPAQNFETMSQTVRFSWNTSDDTGSGLMHYRFHLSADSTFASYLYAETVGYLTNTTVYLPANDTYFWRVVAYDSAWNAETTNVRHVVVDTSTPQAFALDTPADGLETQSRTVVFDWSPSDDTGAGLMHYVLEVSTGPTFDSYVVYDTVGILTYETITLPPNDTFWWRVVAYDSAWNAETSAARWIVVDTSTPQAFLLDTPVQNFETMSQTVRFSWNTSDDTGSGLMHYHFHLSADSTFASYLYAETVGYLTNTTVYLPANDTYFWRVVAYDSAWNAETTNIRHVVVDTSTPQAFALDTPADGLETQSRTVVFDWSPSDDTGAGLMHYVLEVSTGPTFDSYVVYDTVGLATAETITLPPNDTFFWRVVAYDSAWNAETSAARWILIDTTPPRPFAPDTPLDGFETSSLLVVCSWTASAGDTLSGLQHYLFQVSTSAAFSPYLYYDTRGLATETTIRLPANDTYFWRVVAYDSAWNAETAATRFIVVDTSTPQAFLLDTPAQNFETMSQTVRFSWNTSDDTGSGLMHYRFHLSNDSSFASYLYAETVGLLTNTTVALPANDTYFWRVVAYDSAWNAETTNIRHVVVDTSTPQTFALDTPLNGFETMSQVVRFSWNPSTDSGAGLMHYVLQVSNDSAFASYTLYETNGIQTETTVTLPANDTYFWRVVAYDSAWNAETTPVIRYLVVDRTTPQAFLLDTPAQNFETMSQTVRFTWNTSDDTGSGLMHYRFHLSADSTFASYLYAETVGLLTNTTVALPANDTYFWRVVAYDSAWNAETTNIRHVVVDTSTPQAFLLDTPAQDFETSSQTVRFSWNASDDTGAGLMHYRFHLSADSTFASYLYADTVGLQTNTTVTLPANDTYFWRVVAYDSAWNAETTNIRHVVVDTKIPIVVLLDTPAQDFETSSIGAIVFSWSSSADSLSGLMHYRFHLSADSAFASYLYAETVGYLTNTTVSLPANDTYFWRVVAYDSAWNAETSNVRHVVVDTSTPQTFPLDTPLVGFETQSRTVLFDWSPSDDTGAGLMHYVLHISTGPAFDSYVVYDTVSLVAHETITLPSNDTYWWRVVVYDAAWNAETSASRWLLIDTRPPAAFTLDTPAQNFETSSTGAVSFSWNATADSLSGLVHYRFHLSADSSFASYLYCETVGLQTNTTVSLPANDTYFWRVVAYDSAWNAETTNIRHVVVDTSTPQAFLLDSPTQNFETSSQTVRFSWNTSDDTGSGLMHYRFHLSNDSSFASYLYAETVGYLTNTTVYLPANDTYFWRVVAYDSAWNAETTNVRHVVVDTSTPQAFTLDTPLDGFETRSRMVVFDWSPSDDTGAGLMHYVLQVSTEPTFDSYVVYDTVGILTYETITLPPNDTFWWRVVVYDSAWNAETSAARWIVVDTSTPQSFTLDTPAQNFETTSQTVRFSWNTSDDTGSGLMHYRFHLSADSSFASYLYAETVGYLTNTTVYLPANDTYFWRVVAYDSAWNAETTNVRHVVVDTSTPQAFALDTPLNGFETMSQVVRFAWNASNDTHSGLMHYRFHLSVDSTFASYLICETNGIQTETTVTLPPNDTYFWRVVAYDSAWNAETSASIRYVVIDRSTPQAFALDTPSQAFETSSLTLLFQWNASADTHSGLMHYRFHLSNDSSFASYLICETNGLQTNTTVSLPANDTYFWRVVAYDSAWNAETTNVRFLVLDTSSLQTFDLDTPANGFETSSRTVRFQWAASGDTYSGLQYYRFQVSTDPLFAAPGMDSLTGRTPETTVVLGANDTYYWRVVAYDDAWNVETSLSTRRLLIDTSTPSAFTLDTPLNALETSSRTLFFSWNASADTHSGLMHYRFHLSNDSSFASYLICETNGLSTNTTVVLPANDTYYWRAVAYDSAWNAETSASIRWVRPDTQAVVAAVAPAAGHETNVASFRLTWTTTDVDTDRFQLSRDPLFGSLLADTVVTATNDSALLPPLPLEDTYYWRVLVEDDAANTAATPPRLFVLDTSADPAGLDTPLADAISTDSTPALSWNAVADSVGVDSYVIEVSSDPGFASAVRTDTVDSTFTTWSVSPITPQGDYWWRVRSVDDLGNASPGGETRSIWLRFKGTLTLSRGPLTPTDTFVDDSVPGVCTQPPVVAMQVRAAADAEESIRIDTLAFALPFAASAQAHVAAGRLVVDVDRDGLFTGADAEIETAAPAGGRLTFYPALVVDTGTDTDLLVVLDLVPNITAGETFILALPSDSYATGMKTREPAVVNVSLPCTSAIFTARSSNFAFDTPTLTQPDPLTVQALDTDVPILSLRVSVGSQEDVIFASLPVIRWGDVTDAEISRVHLYIDGGAPRVRDAGDSFLKSASFSNGRAVFETSTVIPRNGALSLLVTVEAGAAPAEADTFYLEVDTAYAKGVDSNGDTPIDPLTVPHRSNVFTVRPRFPVVVAETPVTGSYLQYRAETPAIDRINPIVLEWNLPLEPLSLDTTSVLVRRLGDSLDVLGSFSLDTTGRFLSVIVDTSLIYPNLAFEVRITTKIGDTDVPPDSMTADHVLVFYSLICTGVGYIYDTEPEVRITVDSAAHNRAIFLHLVHDPPTGNEMVALADERAEGRPWVRPVPEEATRSHWRIEAFTVSDSDPTDTIPLEAGMLDAPLLLEMFYPDENLDGAVDKTQILTEFLTIMKIKDEANPEWDPVEGAVNAPADRVVRVYVSEFSNFVVAAQQATGSLRESFLNRPNPFSPFEAPGGDVPYGSTRFEFYLPEQSTISLKIYDLAGDLVRTLINNQSLAGNSGILQRHAVDWNGKNADGEVVLNGVYFAVLEAKGVSGTTVVTRKVAVVK